MVKVKFNPSDLSRIHVYDDLEKTYVTLPCEDVEYSYGLSLWAHGQISKFAKAANLKFFSERERHEARRQMHMQLSAISPKLTGKLRKQTARFLSEQSGPDHMTGVNIEYAEPRHDGGGPVVVPHVTLEGIRSDEGRVPPTISRRSKRPQPKPVRGKKAATPTSSRYVPPRVSLAPDKDAFLDSLGW